MSVKRFLPFLRSSKNKKEKENSVTVVKMFANRWLQTMLTIQFTSAMCNIGTHEKQ